MYPDIPGVHHSLCTNTEVVVFRFKKFITSISLDLLSAVGHAANKCYTCENQPSNAACQQNAVERTCSDGPTVSVPFPIKNCSKVAPPP